MTTARDRVPMSKRHGWLAVFTARAVNTGVLPDWYQYWGDETVSCTSPAAQTGVGPEAWARRAGLCFAGGVLEADGEGAGEA